MKAFTDVMGAFAEGMKTSTEVNLHGSSQKKAVRDATATEAFIYDFMEVMEAFMAVMEAFAEAIAVK